MSRKTRQHDQKQIDRAVRAQLGFSIADLAGRAGMTAGEIECIEEGGTEPTIALLRRLAAALDADVYLTAGHDPDRYGSNPTQPDLKRCCSGHQQRP